MIDYASEDIIESIIKRIINSQDLKKRDGFCKLK
jgi:hypothetical protein